MKQYELWWAALGLPAGTRPVVLLSRTAAYTILSRVVVCEITRHARGLRTEVLVGRRDGLPSRSVANLDNVRSLDPRALRERIGRLRPAQVPQVKEALGYALGWPELIPI